MMYLTREFAFISPIIVTTVGRVLLKSDLRIDYFCFWCLRIFMSYHII